MCSLSTLSLSNSCSLRVFLCDLSNSIDTRLLAHLLRAQHTLLNNPKMKTFSRSTNFGASSSSRTKLRRWKNQRTNNCGFVGLRPRASMVDPTSESSSSSSTFLKRMERAWVIAQQPRPVACSTCNSNGHVDCKWCGGTGFFILGDNMLCQVPSRNSSCVICAGKGLACCSDCKGTGFRAKWLEQPPK